MFVCTICLVCNILVCKSKVFSFIKITKNLFSCSLIHSITKIFEVVRLNCLLKFTYITVNCWAKTLPVNRFLVLIDIVSCKKITEDNLKTICLWMYFTKYIINLTGSKNIFNERHWRVIFTKSLKSVTQHFKNTWSKHTFIKSCIWWQSSLHIYNIFIQLTCFISWLCTKVIADILIFIVYRIKFIRYTIWIFTYLTYCKWLVIKIFIKLWIRTILNNICKMIVIVIIITYWCTFRFFLITLSFCLKYSTIIKCHCVNKCFNRRICINIFVIASCKHCIKTTFNLISHCTTGFISNINTLVSWVSIDCFNNRFILYSLQSFKEVLSICRIKL